MQTTQKVKLIAGYWEWNLFLGDDFAYTFGDLGDQIAEIEAPAKMDDYKNLADTLVDSVIVHFDEIEKGDAEEKELTDTQQALRQLINDNREAVVNEIAETLWAHYGE